MAITYKDAGVDIDAGAELVERVRPLAKTTCRPEVIGGLGGFAGLCSLPEKYREPVLVSGTDGVGTKLSTAHETGRHDTVGIDLVAMCVNDVIVTGAEPLLFLDYIGTGRLDVDAAEQVVSGIAEGCRQAGCALVGGETAELPGLYQGSNYDLVGFCVGVVERSEIRDGSGVAAGDAVVGFSSSGLHSNGHSLARKVLLELLGLEVNEVADDLLEPTRIYVRALAAIAEAGVRFSAASHITGGGLIENPPRMLPGDGLAVELDTSTWSVPAIFDRIAGAGVELAEMRRTFNMGLGMLVVVPAADAQRAVEAGQRAGQTAAVVGRIAERNGDAVVFS